MAERPAGYGLTSALLEMKPNKYSESHAAEAMQWIHAITGEELPATSSEDDVYGFLKDGQVLCKLMNEIRPGSITMISTSTMAFKMMENIGNFLTAAENYGVDKADLFKTVDLFDKQNMPQVINGIHALSRTALRNGYGPVLDAH